MASRSVPTEIMEQIRDLAMKARRAGMRNTSEALDDACVIVLAAMLDDRHPAAPGLVTAHLSGVHMRH